MTADRPPARDAPRCSSGWSASTRSTRRATSARRSSTWPATLGRPASRPRCSAPSPERPNLVADLDGPRPTGPTLCFLGHVDTVLADADGVAARPVVRRRGRRLPVGPRRARHEVPGAAEAVAAADAGPRGLAPGARRAEARVRRRRGDRRRRRRPLADQRASGQGPLRHAAQRGRGRVRSSTAAGRHYGVCCAEKGIFRFNVTAHGAAGHASLPRTGDNALLKLAPVLAAAGRPARVVRRSPRRRPRCCAASARIPTTRPPRWRGSRPRTRGCGSLVEPMLGGDADADDGQRLGQDQRDPVARADAGRLPRAARAWARTRPGGGSPRCSARSRRSCGSSSPSRSSATARRSSTS